MRDYVPAEVMSEARSVAAELRPRVPDPGIIDPRRGRREVSIRVRARGGPLDGVADMERVVQATMAAIEREGLAAIHPHEIGELAAFRPFELAAFLNRLRTLVTSPVSEQ